MSWEECSPQQERLSWIVLRAGWEEARSEGEDQRRSHCSLRGQRRGLEGREVEVRVIRVVSNKRRPKMPWDKVLVMSGMLEGKGVIRGTSCQ